MSTTALPTAAQTRALFEHHRVCVLIPTYNNHRTVLQVVDQVAAFATHIVVVNDGSTDDTLTLLQGCHPAGAELHVVSYDVNQGKGHALCTGFSEALRLGFDYALTIDSDGQHYPSDLPAFAAILPQLSRPTIVVGSREVVQKNKSRGSILATRFGNFWFSFQTWQWLPDTQSGYRLYPLPHLHGKRFITSRYEAELELLVFAAWHGVRLATVPIDVYYPPQAERVSHFRPFWDFVRIFVLNTTLFFLCFTYGWWSMLWHRIFPPRIT